MLILVLNCGGSTLKFKLFDMPAERLMARGLVDRLGSDRSSFRLKVPGRDDISVARPIDDHRAGMRLVLDALTDPTHGVLGSLSEISSAAHKLAHGGERLTGPVQIDVDVERVLEEMRLLAPLHNPPNLTGIRIVRELLPDVPQFGTFETSFHRTLPPHARIYGLPYEWYEQQHVRKYGFHSASHRYVASRLAPRLGLSPATSLGGGAERRPASRLISCHLGSGSSVCAILDGQSLDISSGLTPQSGTLMSTRPGDFDPFVITYMMRARGLTVDEIDRLLTRESGLLGISGVSGDMRDLEAAAQEGNRRAELAIEAFCYHVRRQIGAFYVELGGLDALVFTGGIGENSPAIRARVCQRLRPLGVTLDAAANEVRGEERLVSARDSSVAVWVVVTDEELVVARDAFELARRPD